MAAKSDFDAADLSSMLNAESSDLAELSNACRHIQTVSREVGIQQLGAAAERGDESAISGLLTQIEKAGKRQERYMLNVGLRTLGVAAAKNQNACTSLVHMAKHPNFEIRLGALDGFKAQLRSTAIISALQDLQHGGKISAFKPYQRLILEAHERSEDDHHLVRSAAIEALTDLVENLYSESIICVSKRLFDNEEFVRKLAADVLASSLLNCRIVKQKYGKNVFVQEGFARLLNAVVFCFRSGQALHDGDEYMRRTAVNVLATLIDDLDAREDALINTDVDSIEVQKFTSFDVTKKYGRRDVMAILTDSLVDPSLEIRQVATKKILILAEIGDQTALQAVLMHVDNCFELGFGCRNLGMASPQNESLFGKVGLKTQDQLLREAEHEAYLLSTAALQVENERKQGMNHIQRLADQGFVSKIRDIAFPNEDNVGFMNKSSVRREIKQHAAETLLILAENGDENAGNVIIDNIDSFFDLTGRKYLGERSALKLDKLRERDQALAAIRSPNLVELVEVLLNCENDTGTPQSAIDAAVELLRLAEGGDGMAGIAIVRNIAPFLSAIGQAGIFKGKLRSMSEALRGFLK